MGWHKGVEFDNREKRSVSMQKRVDGKKAEYNADGVIFKENDRVEFLVLETTGKVWFN